jgi:hypothetical protein
MFNDDLFICFSLALGPVWDSYSSKKFDRVSGVGHALENCGAKVISL